MEFVQKQAAYHQLLAQNFLRNISLDGSHSDTKLKMFVQPTTSAANGTAVKTETEPLGSVGDVVDDETSEGLQLQKSVLEEVFLFLLLICLACRFHKSSVRLIYVRQRPDSA